MTAPDAQKIADALKKGLTPPNMREDLFLPTRAAASRIYTTAEAMQLIENMATALNRTPRLPIHVTCIREADGSRTIRATPTTQAQEQQ